MSQQGGKLHFFFTYNKKSKYIGKNMANLFQNKLLYSICGYSSEKTFLIWRSIISYNF